MQRWRRAESGCTIASAKILTVSGAPDSGDVYVSVSPVGSVSIAASATRGE